MQDKIITQREKKEKDDHEFNLLIKVLSRRLKRITNQSGESLQINYKPVYAVPIQRPQKRKGIMDGIGKIFECEEVIPHRSTDSD